MIEIIGLDALMERQDFLLPAARTSSPSGAGQRRCFLHRCFIGLVTRPILKI